MHILMVEDDADLCGAVEIHLKKAGHTADMAHDGEDGLHFALQNAYDLILLDRMLPGMDGLELVSRLRKAGITAPVLMVTALDGVSDRVDGLDAGADDYLTKPFELEELEARVRSLLRRNFVPRSTAVTAGPLVLDTRKREISADSTPLPLTRKEFEILEYLMLHPGKTVSQEELLEHIWDTESNPFSHSVRMHISSLRKKLKEALGHDPIATKIGQGYYLEVEP